LLDAAKAAVEANDIEQLAEATLETLEQALSATWVMLCVCDADTRYAFLPARGREEYAQMGAEYADVAAEDPMHRAKVSINPDVAVLTDMVERGEIQRSAIGGLLRRYDTRELLLMRVSAAACGKAGAIAYIAGRNTREGFDNETIDDLRAVRPLFQATIERNERAQLASAIARSSAGGTLALRGDGQLAWMCEEADRLLGGTVPREIKDAVRRAAKLVAADEPAADAPLILPLPNLLLEAHVYPAREAAFVPMLTVVRVIPMRAASWETRLPPRLRRVLELLETGASEKEIADLAGLSYASAHQYVVQIYRRAGVSSRAQLMARLAAGRD